MVKIRLGRSPDSNDSLAVSVAFSSWFRTAPSVHLDRQRDLDRMIDLVVVLLVLMWRCGYDTIAPKCIEIRQLITTNIVSSTSWLSR